VVALGSEVDEHGVPGVREHALGLKTVDDAGRIWAHLQAALEAAGREAGAEERAALQTIVVVGAGWTGTELAGELASLRASVQRTRPPGGSVPRIILLDARETIMPGFSRALAGAARRFFARSGVDVQLRRPVVAVEQDRALLEGGAAIAARTVIWTAGIHGVPAVAAAGLPLVQSGRVRVDTYLRAEGHEDVYVVGDSAVSPVVEGVHVPGPSAQLALHQGEVAAANLAATLSGRSPLPYRPFVLGEALSLGESDGAVIAGPFQLRGRRALALKRAITLNYVRSLGGVSDMLDALGGGL
jgi:NADH dehydrogenase